MSSPASDSPSAFRARSPLLIGLAALLVLWLLASLTFPFGWDQGIFAWVGDAMLHGHAPYRDAWDIKGPLTYAVFAAAEALFGRTLWAIRAFDAVFAVAAAVGFGRLTARLTNARIGWWAGPLFLLWYAAGSFWQTAQPDGWVAMLMIGTALLVMGRPQPVRAPALLAAGALIGLCALFKPPYAAFGLVPLLYVVLTERARPARIVTVAVLLVAGAALPVAVTALWFSSIGALSAMIDAYLRYPAQVYGRVGSLALGERLRGVVEYVTEGRVAVMVFPAALLGAFTAWRRQRPLAITLLCWAFLALLIVMAQNRFYLYHWLVIIPPLALLAAIGFDAALDAAPKGDTRRLLVMILLGLAVLHGAAHPLVDVGRWAARVTGRIDQHAYLEGFGDIPARDAETAAYIREHAAPSDRMLVFGWNTAIVYMSGRQNVSRFGYSMPLMLGEGTPVRERFRAEFMAAVRATPPEWLVVAPQSTMILGKPYQLSDFDEFASFVLNSYREETRFGDLTVYRLSIPATAAPSR